MCLCIHTRNDVYIYIFKYFNEIMKILHIKKFTVRVQHSFIPNDNASKRKCAFQMRYDLMNYIVHVKRNARYRDSIRFETTNNNNKSFIALSRCL